MRDASHGEQATPLYYVCLQTSWTGDKVVQSNDININRRCHQECTIQREPTAPSRMDNPEKTDGVIKNGQSRENRRCHQEWTIQRKPTMPSRMNNPEKLATWGTQSTRRTQTKQKIQHNMCWTPLYVNKHK
jgi:hypothetical protein